MGVDVRVCLPPETTVGADLKNGISRTEEVPMNVSPTELGPESALVGLSVVGQSQYEHQQPNLEDLVDHPIVASAHPALSGAQSTRPGSLAGSKRLDSLHHLKPPRGHRGGGGNIRSYPTASAPVRGDSGAA